MNSTSTSVLVTGILSGFVTLYAYKRGITPAYVMDKIEQKNETVANFINNLFLMAKEFLIKLYEIIVKFVKEIIFKVQMKIDDIKLV